MKKFTKRLTMIVAILLSLVLLSSSILSTTLAKYVVAKDVTSTVSMSKFNVTVTMSKGTSTGVPALSESLKEGDSIEYTMTGITLKPGDDYSNLITASISASANVPVASKVTITVDVKNVKVNETNTSDPFKVPMANFSTLNLTEDKAYLPLSVYVGGVEKLAAYQSYTYSATAIEEAIEGAIGGAIEVSASSNINSKEYTRSNNMAQITGTITKSTKPAWSNISFGFAWPENQGTPKDEIGTWIAKTRPSFDIVYKITVEQQT